MDDHLRRMLAELGSALAESAIELAPTDHPLSDPDPVFKIDGSDLTFLKSIGIDPTRKLRRRRTS